jgi:glutathione peroxidase-family protein
MKKLGLLFVFIISSLLNSMFAQETRLAVGYKPGDFAESFNLLNIDGKMVSPENYPEAKGFVVIFTCNHCPFSIAYEDRIIALDKEWSTKGYPVLALNPNDPTIQPEDSYENMKKRARSKKFAFPYLLDENGKVASRFGATKTPHVYVLNKTSEGLQVAYIGAIDDNSRNAGDVKEKYLENALNQLTAGQSVQVPVTKAIGCSIKRTQ